LLLEDTLTINFDFKNCKMKYCCRECVMEVPSQRRNGFLCISMLEINKFLRNLREHFKFISSPDKQSSREDEMMIENAYEFDSPNYFAQLCLNVLKFNESGEKAISQEDILRGLEKLARPFEQKLVLCNSEKIIAGNSDFSFECCTYVPEKSLIFVGNRSGELFIIDKQQKQIKKRLICPERIGAVKYIPEKRTVVVSGLTKYILKVDIETLEILRPIQAGQTSEYRNFIVIEYLKEKDLLLVGGFNVENSIEIYNFSDLSLERTLSFKHLKRQKVDELWISLPIESAKMLLLGYRSGTLQVWEARDLKLKFSISTSEHIYALEYEERNKLVYTGHLNGVLQIWRFHKEHLSKMKYINTGAFTINKIRFLQSPYSQYLLVSNFAKTLSLWDYLGNKLDELSVFDEPSRAILILDSTTFLCAGATPGAIYFLEIKPNLCPKKQPQNSSPPKEEIMQNTSDICMI